MIRQLVRADFAAECPGERLAFHAGRLGRSRQAWVRDPDGDDIERMEYLPARLPPRPLPS